MKTLRWALCRLGFFLVSLGNRFYTSPAEARVREWFSVKGDHTLRLDYELDESSVVFDLGGYEGQWTSDVFSRYCCRIHVFEPVREFAGRIRQRFAKNPSVTVHPFGLGAKTEVVDIGVSADASSIHKKAESTEKVELIQASEFLQKNGVEHIDLMKINIEGGEYELLEHLLDVGIVERIDNIQVQFHDFVANADERMAAIQKRLSRTHYPTYQYPYVWENWRRKCVNN